MSSKIKEQMKKDEEERLLRAKKNGLEKYWIYRQLVFLWTNMPLG